MFLTNYQYYQNGGSLPEDANWGSYQYIQLDDLVDNYIHTFTGNGQIVNNIPRYKIRSIAKMIIRELSQDAFKEVKVVNETIDENLRMALPHDYVNWVRVSLYQDGVLRPMNENPQILSSSQYTRDSNGDLLFDVDGNVIEATSIIDSERLAGIKRSLYMNSGSIFDGMYGYNIDGSWYFDMRYGDRPQIAGRFANANPAFRVDRREGVIDFESTMDGKVVVLEYVSDGMQGGDDSLVGVNKMFEKYLYRAITFEILNAKDGIQEYVVRRAQKQAKAEWNNAKIRIGAFAPWKLLQDLRGNTNVLK